jgi:gamma-glutamyltranspeptidase/glutathione hydrolase
METDDLAEYHAQWVEPLVLRSGRLTLAVPPPNSQGVTLLWILQELGDRVDSGASAGELVRAKKRAFARRDALLTDAEHMRVGAGELLGSPATPAASPGPVLPRGGDTVYLAAWDASGMLVSMIQSLYYGFGSGVAVPGRGVILQNRGAYFSLDEAAPNVLRPRKRTLHTLMCTLIWLDDGAERVALGTMGGDAQPQILAQVLSRHLAGAGWEEALWAPRWVHGRWEPGDSGDIVRYESRLPDTDVALLAAEAEPVAVDAWDERMGHAHVISVRGEVAFAATDPRSDGAVAIP